MKGILFIVSSPSGGGKGTLVQAILKDVPGIVYSVSYTTRRIREGEVAGREYNFVDTDEFKKLIARGEFLEYAEVHGRYYGTSRQQVEDVINAGGDVVLEIDVQGAEAVKRSRPDSVSIFIVPPSFDVLKERLIARKTESLEEIELRLKNARTEVTHYRDFDYVIVNRDLNVAVEEMRSVIFAERVRLSRRQDLIEEICQTFG